MELQNIGGLTAFNFNVTKSVKKTMAGTNKMFQQWYQPNDQKSV